MGTIVACQSSSDPRDPNVETQQTGTVTDWWLYLVSECSILQSISFPYLNRDTVIFHEVPQFSGIVIKFCLRFDVTKKLWSCELDIFRGEFAASIIISIDRS